MIDDDRVKMGYKEGKYENKKLILNKIESYFDEVLNYIKENARMSPDKNDIITEKLNLVRKQLDEFNNTFNQFNEGNVLEEKSSDRNKIERNKLTESNRQTQQELKESKDSNKDNNLKDISQNNFYLSQTIDKLKANNTFGSRFEYTNQGLTSSFSNFYNNYSKKSLHDDIKL